MAAPHGARTRPFAEQKWFVKRIEIAEELALVTMREADIGSGTTAAQLPEYL